LESINYNVKCIGAGPNDPELLTIKAMKAIKEADIIITPGIQCTDIIKYLNAENKRVKLNWNEYDNHINLVLNNRDKKIVRLYSGDPTLYGSLYVFINDLRYHKIPFEIIPGVTSAFYASSIINLEYTISRYLIPNGRSLLLTTYASNPEFKNQIQGKPNLVIYMNEEYCMKDMSKDLSDIYGGDTICIVFHDRRLGYRDYKPVIREVKIKDLSDYNILEYEYNTLILISHSYERYKNIISPIIMHKIVKGI